MDAETGSERKREGEEEGLKERTPPPGRRNDSSNPVRHELASFALIFSHIRMARISFSWRYSGEMGEEAVCGALQCKQLGGALHAGSWVGSTQFTQMHIFDR